MSMISKIALHTILIDVIPAICHLFLERNMAKTWLLSNGSKTLAQDNQLMAWEVILLDGLADDIFRNSIRVDVRSVPLCSVLAEAVDSEDHNLRC